MSQIIFISFVNTILLKYSIHNSLLTHWLVDQSAWHWQRNWQSMQVSSIINIALRKLCYTCAVLVWFVLYYVVLLYRDVECIVIPTFSRLKLLWTIYVHSLHSLNLWLHFRPLTLLSYYQHLQSNHRHQKGILKCNQRLHLGLR